MTSTPVVLFAVYTAVVSLLAALGADDWQGTVTSMCFYAVGAIALYVAKGAR